MKSRILAIAGACFLGANALQAEGFQIMDFREIPVETENMFGDGNRTHHSKWSLVFHVLERETQASISLEVREGFERSESCLEQHQDQPSLLSSRCGFFADDANVEVIRPNGAIGFVVTGERHGNAFGRLELFRLGARYSAKVHSPHEDIVTDNLETSLAFAKEYLLPLEM